MFVSAGSVWWAPTAMLVISKVFVTISFIVVYIQCAEIYPTSHRGSGTGFSSLISSIFGTMSPYIAYIVSACTYSIVCTQFTYIAYIVGAGM